MNSRAELQEQWLFSVEGMHCLGCLRKIQSAAAEVPNLRSVHVDLASKTVDAKSQGAFDPQKLIGKIESLGFGVRLLSVDSEAKQRQELTRRSRLQLIRLGVAGACAGNIMLLAFAGYAGADQSSLALFFRWLSATFFLPVLGFSAYPFFENSYLALKHSKLSVDVPIALAILGGSALSFYHLSTGHPEVYFDSMAMFIFLLLSARFFIFKLQNKVLSPISIQDIYKQARVECERGGQSFQCSISDLRRGDHIRLQEGAYVPCDGELLSERACINDSFFSGEALPKDIRRLDTLFAGSLVLSSEVELKVLQPVDESRISQLLQRINQRLSNPTRMTGLTDRGAHYLTMAIVAIAGVFLFFYWSVDPAEALRRVLALLVVACPCALAIATPLVHSLSVKKALGFGVLVKNVEALERLQKVRNYIFDKTGTLTQNYLGLTDFDPPLSDEESSILRALEQNSDHPIAKALLRKLGLGFVAKMDKLEEHLGQGVSGRLGPDLYELKALDKGKTKAGLGFYKNSQLQSSCYVLDELDPAAGRLIHSLKSKDYRVQVLSGDQEAVAIKVAEKLNIPSQDVIAGVGPEQKASFIEKENQRCPTAFVGDGVNDSLAMSYADVGISVKRAADASFKSSDIHLLSAGLDRIADLARLSRYGYRIILWNLLFSAAYNLCFATLALLGWIGPLAAVILMPLSSISLALFSFFQMHRWKVGAMGGDSL